MTTYRKRDDLESGELYRVVCRAAGSDDEWVHTNYGHYGKPRTYMTLGAARSMRTSMQRDNDDRKRGIHPINDPLEFAVQRAPVTKWEVVPDE